MDKVSCPAEGRPGCLILSQTFEAIYLLSGVDMPTFGILMGHE